MARSFVASQMTPKSVWGLRLVDQQFGALAVSEIRRGTVGTRSRAIRGSTSDDRVGCSASDGRCAPARPALDVSTRLLPFLPCALASADGIRPFPLLRLL